MVARSSAEAEYHAMHLARANSSGLSNFRGVSSERSVFIGKRYKSWPYNYTWMVKNKSYLKVK